MKELQKQADRSSQAEKSTSYTVIPSLEQEKPVYADANYLRLPFENR